MQVEPSNINSTNTIVPWAGLRPRAQTILLGCLKAHADTIPVLLGDTLFGRPPETTRSMRFPEIMPMMLPQIPRIIAPITPENWWAAVSTRRLRERGSSLQLSLLSQRKRAKQVASYQRRSVRSASSPPKIPKRRPPAAAPMRPATEEPMSSPTDEYDERRTPLRLCCAALTACAHAHAAH